jgi:HEAT repeat protein
MIPAGRRGRALAAACALAAVISAFPRYSTAKPQDCSIQPPESHATAETLGSCKGLDACIGVLIAAAEPGPGISPKERAASRAVLAFGDPAVPALLPLLKSENPDVRDLASYTLRDAPVTEEHLDALIESRLKGDGWIPPAIARIGSPRAIEFLASELRKEREPGTQLTWAFEKLGRKGLPYVVALYDCGSTCDERALAAGAYILSQLGGTAVEAIEQLLVIAEDTRRDRIGRRGAIQAVGSIGPGAARAVPRLKAIAARDPDSFEDSVTQAMIHIGGAAAIEGRRAEERAQDRCVTKGTPEAMRSRTALEALDQRIRAMKSADDLRQAVADLRSLIGSRCFRLAAAQGDPPEFAHPLSLQTWWEAGGQLWLASYVDRPRFGQIDDLRDHVVFPPEPRKVLTLDTATGDTLAPLLCRLADEECGRETTGWAERARDAFSARVVQDRVRDEDAFPVNSQALAARCEAQVRKNEAPPEYARWMECLAEHRVPGWALPLGRFRAPERGWLVIHGRRGHYEFCDELGAYDLETGAAYVAKSCSGLHLRPGGSVDFEATNASRKAAVEAGRVNVANLREAVWMILLAPQAERVFLSADYFPIPKGMVPRPPDADEGERTFGSTGMWNSGQSQLSWVWLMADGRVLASGTLTWPSSYQAPEAHAADLLRIAELGLRPECPPAKLPVFAPVAPQSGVSAIDARPQELTALLGELGKSLREYSSAAACGKSGRE